jgi:hypothetical protein
LLKKNCNSSPANSYIFQNSVPGIIVFNCYSLNHEAMKRHLFLSLVVLVSGIMTYQLPAQVAINSTGASPDGSAILDVKSGSKGMLVPRVTLSSTSDQSTIPSPALSLLVYNTATAGDVVPGYYYWNGTKWATMASGGDFTHYIGELYQGGIIVALWKTGSTEHGLIASLADVSTASVWSNVGLTIGSTAQNPFDGLSNCNAIIAQSGFTGGAAKLCRDYTGGGYSDWYLPASWEIKLCYNAAYIVNPILGAANGFKTSTTDADGYWSSTETGMISAYCLRFYDGAIANNGNKGFTFRVRAVRKF